MIDTELAPAPDLPEGRQNPTPEELSTFVQSAEFKAWFGDFDDPGADASKVVDEHGWPRLVYIGAPAGIQQFHGNARDHTGDDEVGFYATKRYNNARFYAETRRDPATDEPVPSSVYGVFLNMRSPITVDSPGIRTQRVTAADIPPGCDGFINDQPGVSELVVVDPSQICIVSETPINA